MAEKKEPVVPPNGAKPVEILQSRTLEKYELKTGPNLWDTVDYKYVDVKQLVDEVNLAGAMSDFADVADDLRNTQAEKVLLWADREEKYGKNWVICFTKEAEDGIMAEFREKEAAELAAKKAAEEEEARRLAEEEAARNIKYEDKPLVPQPYISDFVDETYDEVKQLTPHTERPLRALTVSRTRESLMKTVRFGPRDSEAMPSLDLRSHKEPVFDLTCQEHQIGLQAGPSMKTASCQTTWFRPTNKAVQYQSLTTEVTEAETEDESKAMEVFFRKVIPMVERALQQNETVDIFRNVFKVLTDEDAALSKQSENELKEIRTFSDINYSKNKVLSAIDWVPKKKGMVAVSAVENISFDARVAESGLVHTSYILLWDFSDLIRPALKLQSPHEIFCFRFCPEEPNFIAAGSMSGQVMFWDVTDAMTIIANKKNRSLKRARRSSHVEEKEEEDEDHSILLAAMKPTAMSHIDTSHRRLVADLVWLPAEVHINFRGQILAEEYRPKQPYQFMTVAGDGLCLFWDVRFQDIAEGKLPFIAKPRINPAEKPNKDGSIPQAPWVPLFRMALKRLEGVGELSLSKVVMNLQQTNLRIQKSETKETKDSDDVLHHDLRSKVFVATEEGDIVFADWRAKSMAAANATGAKEDEDDGPEADFVQWMEWDHPRPCVALQKSPFFPDMVLSVGDWNFQLWKLDCHTPIFSSPLSKVYLTSGCWSPSRPGVLFLGKGDGDVDVWDFTDSSYHPSVSLSTAPSKITSMEFLPPSMMTKQQLLAVGDVNGNLHVFEMPRNLWRAVPNEMGIMESFLQREIMKVGYVVKRFEIRQEEHKSMETEVEFVPDIDKPKTAEMDDARTDGGESGTSEVEVLEPELLEQDEKYMALETEFIEKLELGPEDLSQSYIEEKEEEYDGEAAPEDEEMNRTVTSMKSRGGTVKSLKG